MVADPLEYVDDTMHLNMQYAASMGYDFLVLRCPSVSASVPNSDFTWNLPNVVYALLPQYDYIMCVYNKLIAAGTTIPDFLRTSGFYALASTYVAMVSSEFLSRSSSKDPYVFIFTRTNETLRLVDTWASHANTALCHDGLHNVFTAAKCLQALLQVEGQPSVFVAPASRFEPWISNPSWILEGFRSTRGPPSMLAMSLFVSVVLVLLVALLLKTRI